MEQERFTDEQLIRAIEQARKMGFLIKSPRDQDGGKWLKAVRPRQTFLGENTIEEPITVCLIDCETTGLKWETDEVIETGAIKIEVCKKTGNIGRVLGVLGELEQPQTPITEETTKLNGITNEDVEGKSFNDEAWKGFVSDVELMVAHNASFDCAFLNKRFPFFAEKKWACSIGDIGWTEQDYEGNKLFIIAVEQGFNPAKTHRAVDDCYILAHAMAVPLKDGTTMPFSKLFESLKTPRQTWHVSGYGYNPEINEKLKARDFRWEPEGKQWWKDVTRMSEEERFALKEFFCQEIKGFVLGTRTMDGVDRYSTNYPRMANEVFKGGKAVVPEQKGYKL